MKTAKHKENRKEHESEKGYRSRFIIAAIAGAPAVFFWLWAEAVQWSDGIKATEGFGWLMIGFFWYFLPAFIVIVPLAVVFGIFYALRAASTATKTIAYVISLVYLYALISLFN